MTGHLADLRTLWRKRRAVQKAGHRVRSFEALVIDWLCLLRRPRL